MSRWDAILGILANTAQAASAVADWQAGRNIQAELEHHRFALHAERERNAQLLHKVAEMRTDRDAWQKAHAEQELELVRLRKEVAMAKKPPPKPAGKMCKGCGKPMNACKCK